MKKLLIIGIGIICAESLFAQNAKPKEIHYPDGSFYKSCVYVKATKPFSELVKERDAKLKANPELLKPQVAADGAARENTWRKNNHRSDANAPMIDEARQSFNGTKKMAGSDERVNSSVNFDGQGSIGGYPMDPNGMVSTLYYVQTINSSIEAWHKNGTVYIPQTDLRGLFGSLGSCDCGDPVTIYDKVADRWIISEFEGGINPNPNIDTLLFAVSQTNDPNGTYWLYAFVPDINSFDDYPKYNVWGDGYYMTCNCDPDYVVAYQRDSMLVGGNAGMIAVPWGYGPYNLYSCGGNFFCPMMLDCDGTLPPYGSPEYLFYYWDANWGCAPGAQDSICIEKISMNWVTKTGTVSSSQHLNTAAFNSNFPADFDANLPQPGNNTFNYVASSDGFFAYRIPYLRWSSYNSAVMVNPVNVGTLAAPVSGERWYELRQDTTTKLWSIYQQSTYAPADGVSRWNGTIAMNQNGDIGLAYNVTDPVSVYPGIRYTGRNVCDPLNTMTMTEVTAVSGNTLIITPQGNGNRWGDYSHLSVDPSDGLTFWHTNMYSNSGFSGFTNMDSRIFNFQIGRCTLGINELPAEGQEKITAYQDGGTLNIKGINLPVNERVVVELFDANGKTLIQKAMTTSMNTLETSFNVASLAKALYIVRIGNDSFQRVAKLTLN